MYSGDLSEVDVLMSGDLPGQAEPQKAAYPTSVMVVAVLLMLAGTAPIAIVFLMRRFQCVKADMDIQQAAIKRIDTTTSTTGMVREAEVRARGEETARRTRVRALSVPGGYTWCVYPACVVCTRRVYLVCIPGVRGG